MKSLMKGLFLGLAIGASGGLVAAEAGEPTGFGCYEDRVVHGYFNSLMSSVEAGLQFKETMIRSERCIRTNRIPTRAEMVNFVTIVDQGPFKSGYVPVQINGETVLLVGRVNLHLFNQGTDT